MLSSSGSARLAPRPRKRKSPFPAGRLICTHPRAYRLFLPTAPGVFQLESDGIRELLKRIDDADIRPRLIKEMEENLKGRGGADSLLIADSPNREFVGKRLDAIAKQMNKPPVEAALELIKLGSSGVISFNMNESDVRRFMKENFVTTCSDGSAGHPRKYGTFPKKLREYVYNQKLISLPFAVRNSSALTAETFRIPERGMIRKGYFADVIVFDPKTYRDVATFEKPHQYSTGVKWLFVNGQPAIEDGKHKPETLAGQVLRHVSALKK